jgi:hypothetical protein
VAVGETELWQVGPYQVERELGRGAFGVVYKARHRDDPDIPVALKVIEANGNLDRLMLEPALVASLDHPCIIRVTDYFAHQGTRLAMAMEYVDGEDLKAAIDSSERFPQATVREMLVQIAGALAEAHAKGVVHRDLKPANVLLDRAAGRTRYVLTDFGVGIRDAGIKSEKRVAGTYLFMAPEQLRGRAGPQSDLWALGVIAYRMLTGKYPFPGPTVAELARQIQLTTPPPPGELAEEPLDPDLERAVLKLLDRSETERTASAKDLLAELGHRGDAKSVLADRPEARTVTRVGTRQESLDETLRRGVRRNYVWMGVWAGLYFLCTSPLNAAVMICAMVVFYRAHARMAGWRKAGAILASFVLIVVGWAAAFADSAARMLLTQVVAEAVTAVVPVNPAAVAGLLSTVLSFGVLALPILACSSYAKANRLRRDRVLLRAAAGGTTSDEYVELLRRELEYRYEDVGFHLKYAEALAARGDDAAAAVEARLLLVQDPYHFTGNLLLAQCYHRLGLHDDCVRVCDEYLAVSGYCFEFAELRDLCRKGVSL